MLKTTIHYPQLWNHCKSKILYKNYETLINNIKLCYINVDLLLTSLENCGALQNHKNDKLSQLNDFCECSHVKGIFYGNHACKC